MGLALLKCDIKQNVKILEYQNSYLGYYLGDMKLETPGLEKDENYLNSETYYDVYVAGYPMASSQLLVDEPGKPINTMSNAVPFLWESTSRLKSNACTAKSE